MPVPRPISSRLTRLRDVAASNLVWALGTQSCGCFNKNRLSNLTKQEWSQAAKVGFYRQCVTLAEKRWIPFELSFQDVLYITSRTCHYCGIPPNVEYGVGRYYGTYWKNGIDRVDSSKRYTLSNCLSCCVECNKSKVICRMVNSSPG